MQIDVSLSYPRKSNFVLNMESRPVLEEVLDKVGKCFKEISLQFGLLTSVISGTSNNIQDFIPFPDVQS